MKTVIRGTGMYVPEEIVDNARLSLLMDTDDEWVVKRTGIRERRYASPEQATSDLGTAAARQALEDAGLRPEEIDYVIFATMTPDHYFPGAGVHLQRKLGLRNVPCLDIRQQCAGFLYGMQTADAIIRSGQAKRVLVIGAEIHVGFMPYKSWDVVYGERKKRVPQEEFDWNTTVRDRLVIFGDGAGAFVLEGEEDSGTGRGILDMEIFTDGALADKLWVDGGGSAYRPYFDASMQEDGRTMPIVQGREVFRLAVTLMPEALAGLLEKNGFDKDDLDLVVMHQANLRINEAIQQRIGLRDDQVFNNIQKYGNTTAATLPMAYHEAIRERDLPAGSLVAFVALGSGLHWGALLYRS
jgi:3-oxoacyl-[acyl-carrier-protein] synthase-3